MYAKGNSNKEIHEQMKELYGVHISLDMVNSITNKVILSFTVKTSNTIQL